MTTVNDIYSYIDSFAPFDTAESYDNVGILVGNPHREVTRVLAALDITPKVVEEAVRIGAEAIVSHHPIIFTPVKRVLEGSAVHMLIKNDITAIAAHTNLDKSPIFGVNTELARAIELTSVRVSEKNELLFIGETRSALSPEEFAVIIKERLQADSVAFTAAGDTVSKVGVCSGAGGSEIFSAGAECCDAFVTGEMKHHELMAANDMGISVFVTGHYRSEDVVIEPLCRKLSEQFCDVEFVKSEIFSDGVMFK